MPEEAISLLHHTNEQEGRCEEMENSNRNVDRHMHNTEVVVMIIITMEEELHDFWIML
jgi:hypothetical protein